MSGFPLIFPSLTATWVTGRQLTERGSGNVAVSSSAYVQRPSWRYRAFVLSVASCFEMAATTCAYTRGQPPWP